MQLFFSEEIMKKYLMALPLLLLVASCGEETNSSDVGSSNDETITSSIEDSETKTTSKDTSEDSSEDTPEVKTTYEIGISGDEAVLKKVKTSEKSLVLPSTYEGKPLTRILNGALQGLTKLESVTVPENVREIGDNAFHSCTNLIDVKLPSTLRKIGNYAFTSIPYIESITLPEGLEEIGSAAFSICNSLTNIFLPSTLRHIDGNVFNGEKIKYTTYEGVDYLGNENNKYLYAAKLSDTNITPESVSFHNDTKIIGPSILEGESSVTSITLNEGITYIGGGAFRNTSITEISIPSTVKEIDSYAFEGCTKLVTCTILGNSLETIQNEVFTGSSALKTINIPNSVKEVGSYAFCKFNDSSSLEYTISENGKYLGNETNPYHVLVGISDATASEFKINEKTVVIAGQALANCNNIATFTIPSSVKYICDNAFFQMNSLTSLTIPESVLEIGGGIVGSCSSLTSFTLNNKPTVLKSGLVSDCSSLKSFVIPSTVKKIEDHVFQRNKKLDYLVIPSTVLEIASEAITSADNTILYIEAEDDLYLYGSDWFTSSKDYFYGNEWHYENNVPTPNK